MNLEYADQPPLESPLEAIPDAQVIRKSKISYTSEYLLSFSDLDICKKLPHGFESSILSELEDASSGVLDRQRGQGGFLLQGSKRGDYGAPMARLEGSNSYSRGSTGRWDTRSSGSSDWDGDSQNERETSMSDKRFGSQYRRQWQNTEHDGLLGSGAFPRPSGYTGTSAPKAQGSGQYQLNRSTEPYQPPRSYKRKDNIDSCNEETFGSAECSSEDKAEEERKRRDSFELMRKEQHKALQEKQTPDNLKEKLSDDIISLFHNSIDKKTIVNKTEKPDEAVTSFASQSGATRNSIIAPTPPASRPLVPPGFATALVEKKLCRQSSNSSLESEPRNAVSEENLRLDGLSSSQEKENQPAAVNNICKNEIKTTSIDIGDEAQKLTSLSLSSGEVIKSVEVVDSFGSGLVKVNEFWKDEITDGCSLEQEASSKMMGSAGPDHAVTLLEQFFGNALSKGSGGSPKHVENQCLPADEDILHPAKPESSKFAHWFLKEDINPVEDFSSKDLLSLIVNNEKVAPSPSTSPAENIDSVLNLVGPPEPTSTVGSSENRHCGDMPGSSPVVLTCEDLEQFMLAEASYSSPNPHLPAQAHRTSENTETLKQKADVDDHASQHLLSLLQKGKGRREKTPPSPTLHMGSTDGLVTSEIASVHNAELVSGSGKSLTLKALFRAAFMNELHSREAPISTWRPPAGGPNYNDVPLSHGQKGQHMQKGHAFDLLRTGVEHGSSLVQNANVGSGSFDERGLEIRLPEEESLFTVNDSLNSRPPDVLSLRSTNMDKEVNSKLLNSIPRDMEHLQMLGPDDLSDIRRPPDQAGSDNLHHLLQGRSSELPHQMAHTRRIFPQLDVDMNQQSKFIAPEAVHHDPRHPLVANLIPRQAFPTAGGPRFDPAAHHLMLQHMPLAENFAPPYPVHGLPRGVPATHPMHQIPGYIPELNNVNSFPMHHRHFNYGQGMPMPGLAAGDIRGSHPEALERLIQMELRARSKQAHPAMAGHVPGTYGPELDMNFRYR